MAQIRKDNIQCGQVCDQLLIIRGSAMICSTIMVLLMLFTWHYNLTKSVVDTSRIGAIDIRAYLSWILGNVR